MLTILMQYINRTFKIGYMSFIQGYGITYGSQYYELYHTLKLFSYFQCKGPVDVGIIYGLQKIIF